MVRYGFSIRTRSGQRVDNVSILAASQGDAERRLRQMYERCQIVECTTETLSRRVDALDLASVIALISAAEPPAPLPAPSRHKPGTH